MARIFAKRVVTKPSVPTRARNLWAQCVVQALLVVVATNSEAACADLPALPKATLPSTLRGGRGRKRDEAETKKHQCNNRLEGQRAVLWARAQERPDQAQPHQAGDNSS